MNLKKSNSVNLWKGPLSVLSGGICIGFAPIGLRLGLNDLGPQAIAFWRFFLALPFLFLLVVAVGRKLPSRPNPFVVFAGICFASNVGLWHWALSLTTVANATFIVNFGNIGVGFLAWIVLKEKPKPIWFVAILIAALGAAALSLGGGESGKGVLKGDMLALAAACFISAYMLFSKLARNTLSGLETIFWLTIVELCVSVIWVKASGEYFLPVTLSGLAAPLFLAIIVQVVGQGLIISGLGHTPASIAGLMVVIQPVIAAAFAWSMFEEPLTALQLTGGLFILIAIWLSQQNRLKQRNIEYVE